MKRLAPGPRPALAGRRLPLDSAAWAEPAPLCRDDERGAVISRREVDESRIDKGLATRYCDRKTSSLDEALAWISEAVSGKQALSVGLVGNAAEVLPELVRRKNPDVVHRPDQRARYAKRLCPARHDVGPFTLRYRADPQEYSRRAVGSIVQHVRAMLELQARGSVTFDYGNNIRTVALDAINQR